MGDRLKMPIQTITQVTIPFCMKLKKRKEPVLIITDQNGKRDRLIQTDKHRYYLKFQDSKKWKNEWSRDKVQFRTINKSLADGIKFDYLVIGDSEGKLWITHKDNLAYAKIRTQYETKEEVYNLEEKYFEEMM